MSTAAEVADRLRQRFGVDATIEHRVNHTGATKLSFAVRTPAGSALWVKVATTPADNPALDRWARFGARLAERYLAPPVLESWDLGEQRVLVFPLLEGTPGTRSDLEPALPELLKVLGELHADVELAQALGPAVSARASFRDLWVRRLEADLAIVAGHVEPAAFAWMQAEVRKLSGLLDAPSFDRLVQAPVHGDPWHENVLVSSDRLWLLDWEDLAVGDPVVDDAIMLVDLLGAQTAEPPPSADPGRFAVAVRALMLDAVIDTAADMVESDDPAISSGKDAQWRTALTEFEARYPS